MKQPKRPTLAQKKRMALEGLDWKEYNVSEETDQFLIVIHKKTGRERLLQK